MSHFLMYIVDNPSSHGDKPLPAMLELIDIWFPQKELDKANDDKKHFPPGFKVIYSEGFQSCSIYDKSMGKFRTNQKF